MRQGGGNSSENSHDDNSLSTGGSGHHHNPYSKDKHSKRKKHLRRTAAEIEKEFIVREHFLIYLYLFSVHMLIVESFTAQREV